MIELVRRVGGYEGLTELYDIDMEENWERYGWEDSQI